MCWYTNWGRGVPFGAALVLKWGRGVLWISAGSDEGVRGPQEQADAKKAEKEAKKLAEEQKKAEAVRHFLFSLSR